MAPQNPTRRTPHTSLIKHGLGHASVLLFALAIAPSSLADTVGQLAPGVYRHDSSSEARASALPSLSFEQPDKRENWGRLSRRHTVQPAFATDDAGRHTASIAVPRGTNLYATGMVAGPIERTGRKTVAWNTDSYAYDESDESLYQSHPWVLAVRRDGSAFGALADTTYRCEIDLRDGIRFSADGPAFPVIVFEATSPQEVLTLLTEKIGRIDLPPLWTLGYHQCRYSYFPDTRAREIAKQFRDRNIPCDVIWHDIHYMDDNVNFTFHPERFPDPAAHNRALHDMNFKAVYMINTGQGIRPGFFVYDQLRERGLYVKDNNSDAYVGEVWPGPCLFPDFTNRQTRDWWAGLIDDFVDYGVDGIWNDMNEPAVFNSPGWTMPGDNRHDADPELGGPGPHARYHNVYGMLMAKATREGKLRNDPDKRPFVLTRANYIGGHRYAAMWTGDNVANWENIDWSISMILTLGLSAQPFSGPDIGGFKGSIDGPAFARWMGIGAMLPFARGHTEVDSIDKEPWSFGPEIEEICRLALQRRYQLLPHIYTAFREASVSGIPVCRPLFFEDPRDPRLREIDDGFMLGDGLLVWCQVHPEQRSEPVLPRADWRPMQLAGSGHPELPQLFVRGGAIIPTGPIQQYVTEKPLDPITLHIALDREGRASGTLYEDANDGHGYRNGDYLLTTYAAEQSRNGNNPEQPGNSVIVYVKSHEGNRPRPERKLTVVLLTGADPIVVEGRDGETIKINLKP